MTEEEKKKRRDPSARSFTDVQDDLRSPKNDDKASPQDDLSFRARRTRNLSAPDDTPSLREVAKIFFRLGILGFGGPLSTMSMMEEETSRRRQWVSTAEFNEAYTLCKILPGPAATQMAIYLGHKVAGRIGGLIAGAGFILPSFVLVLGLSWLYTRYGTLLRLDSLFLGMQAAALAVIFSSLVRMAAPYKRHLTSWLIGVVSLPLVLVAHQWEPLIIIGARS